jgi:hypothetical protein
VGPFVFTERGLNSEDTTRGAKRQKTHLKKFSFSPTFASLKINAVAAFSIYIRTHKHTHTHTARLTREEEGKQKVRSLLFYPLGDGTIESSPREKKKKKRRKKKGERENCVN